MKDEKISNLFILGLLLIGLSHRSIGGTGNSSPEEKKNEP